MIKLETIIGAFLAVLTFPSLFQLPSPVALSFSYPDTSSENKVIHPNILHYSPPEIIPQIPHSVVFIHSMVGTFKKKRGKGTWGHGQDILIELLETVATSGLSEKISAVYITLLGSEADRAEAKISLREHFRKVSEGAAQLSTMGGSVKRKVDWKVIVESNYTEIAEFPTLWAMQDYSDRAAGDKRGVMMLYMHTKGVRKNGYSDYPSQWRKYMAFFLVERHSLCMKALQSPYSYKTCGVLKQQSIYQGNFWWSTAQWLSERAPKVSKLAWTMQNRYAAEEYLLKGVPGQQLEHYCVHHAHHTMQVCPTPRHLYESAVNNNELRKNPNCFDPGKLPRNRTKDPSSWCHHMELPQID